MAKDSETGPWKETCESCEENKSEFRCKTCGMRLCENCVQMTDKGDFCEGCLEEVEDEEDE